MNNPQDFSRVARYAAAGSSKVHVLFRKEDLDGVRLPDKVVVVLDILFATTTIVTALAHGATEVVPAIDEHDALEAARAFAADSYLLAGEKNVLPIDGFASPLPLTLTRHDLPGRSLIYSTTNGTVALRMSEPAPHVFAASLLNGAAVARHIREHHSQATILIVCSGSAGGFNLEDLYGAGYMVDLFAAGFDERRDLSDAALAARRLYNTHDAFDCLISSRVGRMMQDAGFEEEVRFAAREDVFQVVPKLDGGRVRLLA
jgi:2-phosphosulfolactate phosphatase